MKHAKSAAIVAGSVMALGFAAPAVAAPPGAPTMSLNGGLADALQSTKSGQLDGHQVRPLVKKVKTAGEKVKSANANKLLSSATGAVKSVPLLGGLPLK
ncbi:hypothetical protein [Streptomyces lydicus]|uniref:ATP-binding protein n=1 Tax=Streptomyces lydicus TaxID=47763 RepID=A0A1D7VUV6_9ACTN|nr:hypothetical protein [Streptomyces lydicus]AOP50530.1 hypothetical protein SL103_33530 [Streptomyces lydicus]